MPKLYAWRVQPLWFVEGDTVRLHAMRGGALTLWPLFLAEPYRTDMDFSARTLRDLKA
jgi:hypothetical protein